MNKRIVALGATAAAVLGLAGTALAAPSGPPSGLEEAALSLAADPAPGPPADKAARREQLRTCAKAKVDAGAEKREAVKACATELGVEPGRPGKAGKAAKRLGRAAHAELIVPKRGAEGTWETIVVDRGKVTAASAESVSLQRPDGPTVSVRVVAGTKVRGAASAAELATGRQVVVVSAGGEARSIVSKP